MIGKNTLGEIYSSNLIDVEEINNLISILKNKYRDLHFYIEFSHLIFINFIDEDRTTLIISVFEGEKIRVRAYYGLYNSDEEGYRAFNSLYIKSNNSKKLSNDEVLRKIPELIYFMDFQFN